MFVHRQFDEFPFSPIRATCFANLIILDMTTVLIFVRHYATNRQGAGSISDGVIGIFQRHNPSSRTMALGSTQPLREMSTKCISWG
jgi:hypothetical protein